ncbi:MAG: YigZ family protein [Bacteroidales bacterium]|nr:YigZ family protein [Bacteroidales bacterium]
MSDIYYTLSGPGEGKYTEKMSRFLSFAFPVESADRAKEIIKKIQNEYHDSRHVCWAYMIGPDRTEWQLNDNGEPSGTAGKPILGQINSFGLTDVLIAVVRYFGGIKLGTSGLIVAYREAARLAIENAGVREMFKMSEISVTFPYMSMNDVMKLAKMDGVEIVRQTFDNTCEITLRTRDEKFSELSGKLLAVDGVSRID